MINNGIGCPILPAFFAGCGNFEFDESLIKVKIPALSLANTAKDKNGAPIYYFSFFLFAQPSLTTCFARPNASESGGTSWVMHEAAAI
jgi:hypothetical protein